MGLGELSAVRAGSRQDLFQACLERIRPKGKGMLVKLKGKATDDVYVGPVIALQANKRLRTFP